MVPAGSDDDPPHEPDTDRHDGEGSTMEQFDGTVNAGRKGVAYDWQGVLAAVETAQLERQLGELVPQLAD